MRIGAFLPPWGPWARPDDFDTVAAAVEALGYASLWVGDHIVFPRAVGSRYLYNETGRSPFDPDGAHFEPLTLLSYLAGRTRRVALGLSVLVAPIRNPVLAAKMLANLDALSRGRLVVGVGVGWMREEFEALRAPDFEARGEVTDEYVALFRHLWTTGGTEPFRGRHYRLGPVGLAPKPERPIPMVIGGNTRRAMRRAARLGDGWHALRMTPDEIQPRIAELRRMAAEEGRDLDRFSIVVRAPVVFGEAEGAPGSTLTRRTEDIRAAMDAYAEAGVHEFIVEVPDVSTGARVASLEHFAREVGGPLVGA